MNNTVPNIFKRNSNFLSSVAKQDSNEEKKERSSFYDDYLEKSNQNKEETGFSINRSVLKLPDLTPQKTQPNSQNPETTGSAIKKNIESVLSKKYGELDTRHIFDGIDDKDIEDNLVTAENTIKTNVDRGALSKNILPKLPNLRDGLALSYAAANKGKSKAAKRAIEAAYTEQESDKLLLNVSDNQLTNQPTKYSNFYNDYIKNKEPSQNNSNSWNKFGQSFDSPKVKENPKNNRAFETGKRSSFKEGSSKVESKNEPYVERNNNGSEIRVKASTSADKLPQNSSNENVAEYLKKYFEDDYNVGKTTTDIVINEMQLESLHKYLSNAIKNAERPNYIGKGLWAKQVQNDLKWVDDMFGKGSKLAKALKGLPAITVGIDTLLGINENVKNKSNLKETLSDVGIDIAAGGVEALAAVGVPAALSYVAPTLAGGVPGLIISILAGLATNYALDHAKYGGDKTIKEIIDSKV